MTHPYRFRQLLSWWVPLILAALFRVSAAQAQSGPYGNEWIVPGQQYYKIKVAQDGVYHLDYNYLTQAGISGVNPQRFQLWRRGKEVAIYVGPNNPTTLSPATYIEFYGQRNDGALDVGMYKRPQDHYQKYYSLYTDTASYFLTWSATTNGKRITPSSLAPVGGNHPYWLKDNLLPRFDWYGEVSEETSIFNPWGEAGEGFLSYHHGVGRLSGGKMMPYRFDSLGDVLATGPAPRVELMMAGASISNHELTVYVEDPVTKARRALGPSFTIEKFGRQKVSYAVQRSDIAANGTLQLQIDVNATQTGSARNFYRMVYARVTYPVAAAWPSGRSEVRFQNDSTLGAAPAYYQLSNAPASVRGFDVTDPYNVQRIEGVVTTGTQRAFVFPNAVAGNARRNLVFSDVERARTPLPARRVSFRAISPAAHNFLIVSSARLMKPAGSSANPVRDYAVYRAAKYDTLVVTSEQLYDQFHYGEKSALAIRHFAQFMLTNPRQKYLMLLGQGLQPGELIQQNGVGPYYFHRQFPEQFKVTDTGPVVRDLVPTSTRGASDIFFTADWEHDDYAGRMGTGRLSVATPAEIVAYLEKLKQYELKLDASLETQPWRKNALNLLGGEDEYDYQVFSGFLAKYKKRIESPFFAGKVVNTYSNAGIVSTKNISADLNAGLSLITYFGHGFPDILQLDLGDINDPTNGYNNVGKYPIMFIDGCAAGNSFRAPRAKYAQDWLLAEQKGLIGLMSESSFGFPGDLHAYQDSVFRALLNDPQWYGRPVADVQNEAIRRLQKGINRSESAISSWMTTVWHADPALRMYSPLQPDFAFGAPALEIKPVGTGPVRANSPSFNLLVRVKNTGKVTRGTLDIQIERRYDPSTSDNRQPDTYVRTVPQPITLGDTTYVLPLPNPPSPAKIFGNNSFTVTLDYQNKVAELDENNNQAKYDFVFLQEGVTLLNPPEFALVAPNQVRLVGQTNDPVGKVRGFEMELDTVPTFTSTLVQRTKISAALLADWRPKLPTLTGRDSVVWYWRMRFETPVDGESNEWSTSSFRVVKGTTGGWSQSHHGQFKRNELKRLEVAAPPGKWSFTPVSQSVTLQTKGGGDGSQVTYQPGFGIQLGNEPVSPVNCGTSVPNILVAVYDGSSLRSVRNIGGGPYDSCGQAPNAYYHFANEANPSDNINTPARRAQLLSLLTHIPQGAYVALVSINKVDFTAFSPALKAAFAALGAKQINSLQDGEPYAFFSHNVGGQLVAQEATATASSSVPRTSQGVTLAGTLSTFGGSGALSSVRIGPAQQWTALHHTIRTEPSDSYKLQLIGIDTTGTARVLDVNVTNRAYSLANVPAKTYPYLQLVLTLRDTLNRTAPQVKELLVTYRGFPEGVVRRDSVVAKTPTAYDPAVLAKQATDSGTVTVPVIFQNVSSLPFGTPLKAIFTLRSGSKQATKEIDVVPAPGANGAVAFNATLSVLDLYGDISGSVVLNLNKNGRRLPELYYFNNELTIPTFHVEDRSVPPVLDVAFDGQHILNGDIVSPRPIITVVLTDEDKLRPITDRNAFDLVLTPRNGSPMKIDLAAANVTFTTDPAKGTARIDFEPGKTKPLTDGQYTLEVQGRDATGRTAGAQNYKVQFEVVNASTITNIFPYPNPITHKAKFVFTLTGAELPRNMKIQIMTMTGKVVRQIMMEEMGMLRIGNNMTDYAWDGTDEYGDQLANGTYLYRVVLDDPGKQFERRTTVADKAFKNGWGKLVLLR